MRMKRIITSSGSEIGYAQRGQGEATPIVFLHGVGSDKSVWRPQLDYFARTRRAIAFDYPGYGDSDPAPPETTRDDYAAAVLSGMRALGIERAHVCGLSLGGIVAIAIHHLAADRCASLILADTFACHPDGQAIYDRSIEGSRNLAAMAAARVEHLLAEPAEPSLKREIIETMARIDPEAYRIAAKAVWLADQHDRTKAIKVPTMIICGEFDRPTPPKLSRELQMTIAHSKLEIIGAAGHLTNIEQPRAFNRIVDEFLKTIER